MVIETSVAVASGMVAPPVLRNRAAVRTPLATAWTATPSATAPATAAAASSPSPLSAATAALLRTGTVDVLTASSAAVGESEVMCVVLCGSDKMSGNSRRVCCGAACWRVMLGS